jgi:hypothetical protein
MINLLDYKPVKKNEIQKVLKIFQKISKKNPQFKGLNYYSEKNARGDYGYNDIYEYKNVPFMVISIDGARIDVKYYLSSVADDILNTMLKDAKIK